MRVGIIGGSGYAGGSLVQLLSLHPNPEVELTYVTSRALVGKPVHTSLVNLRGVEKVKKLKFEMPSAARAKELCDLVFLAVPHKTSYSIIKEYLDAGLKVIDLSADFRLKDQKVYEHYYGPHGCPELFKDAVYGMPETHKEEIKNAKIVAVPGCHAASAIYALMPLVKENLIQTDKIIVDSKTGSSGSGAEASESTHHPIRANSIRPYGLTGHRHTAEIEQELELLSSGNKVTVGFSAHGANIVRGILSTSYAFLNPNKTVDDKTVIQAYRSFYKDSPFVRFMRLSTGVFRLPDPKLIAGTNYVDVGFELDDHMPRIVAVCALDNLIKGTAGNALQCMNIMCGYPETQGLEFPGLFPY
jgi:N-acetyl-gamma-glutamyl-phosphate/LysW-gamma-L-alpha-aminoadipyl-6-phosphate reductase